jgi:hypothetical protein
MLRSKRFQNKEERLQFWSEHSRKFAASAQTLQSYCAEQKISHHTFSYWRAELKRVHGTKSAAKKSQSKFVPIRIAEPPPVHQTTIQIRELPDAKWVADFMRHFLRGSL